MPVQDAVKAPQSCEAETANIEVRSFADVKNRGKVAGVSLARTPRREFSRTTKALAWKRSNARCEGWRFREEWVGGELVYKGLRCEAPLDVGCFHYDHINTSWMSGDASLDNCAVLCVPCHREKTKRDVKIIAKVKRIRDKRIKAKTPRQGFRGWRKFSGEPVYARDKR